MARILVTGAAGFIGRHVVAALLERRHSVVGVLRGPTPPSLADHSRFTAIRKDLSTLTDAENWRDIVSGVDVVLNCAGVLQAGRRTMTAVHERAPQALFAAAAEAGISRILQVSAISADADTMYAQTKRAADESLMELDLDWVVVRPSLVYARGSYGGTSLLRGLAALPGAVVVPGDGGQTFRPVYMDDLVGILCELCETRTIKRYVIEPVGPEAMTLRDIVTATRRWLDLPAAPVMQIPMALVKTAAKVGDLLRWKVVNSTAVAQITHGNTGSSGSFAGLYAPAARSMDDVFAATPSSVQDRWHARLALLAPVLTAVLALMWLVSGIIGLSSGTPLATSVLQSFKINQIDARMLTWVSSGIDVAVGFTMMSGLSTRLLASLQISIIAVFTVVLSLALPNLWLDPLGPLVKNVPILILICVWAAVRSRR